MNKTYVKIYWGMVLVLSISAFIYTLLPIGDFGMAVELPASKPVLGLVNALIMLILYGGIGFLGLYLADKNGFTPIWNSDVKKKFVKISIVGLGVGAAFVVTDIVVGSLFTIPDLMHPPFPASIFASINAGIGEEIVFRLFFISFWFWVLSKIIKHKSGRAILFWVLVILSAVVFAAGHMPSIMLLYGYTGISDIPFPLFSVIMGLNGLLSVFAAYYLKKFGFFAAVWIHFLTDIVWHVVYGALCGRFY